MNIILQNYLDLLKKVIFDSFSYNLKKELNKIDINGNVMNYVDLLSTLDESLCLIAKNSLITILETIDKSYSISIERKRKFDIKSYHSRTIMTIFGEITFKRTFYTNKINGKNFCYLDRLFGLHKYDYFDPYLKALIIDFAANNSYSKTANYINNLIGNRIKLNCPFKYISRQTVRNIIMSNDLSNPEIKPLDTPSILYIIADEKWIHTQNNNNKDIMMKSIVLFESINNHKLFNKQVFANKNTNLLTDDCLNYICKVYDVDKIKTIYIIGDGASWINSLRQYFKLNSKITVIQGLDKFHFKQAIHHIGQDSKLEKVLTSYVINNNKKEFKTCINHLIESNPYRKKTIEDKKQYILNNWSKIKNLYKYNLSCPMESQISHNIAAFFTSRPKGYSTESIKKLIKIRLLYKNNYNIKELFLNNFNSDEILTINEPKIMVPDHYKKETFTLLLKHGHIKLDIY